MGVFKKQSIILGLILVVFFVSLFFINLLLENNENKNHIIYVTAHRGDSKNYPENTMSAFMGAYEKGADYIELDIHETKDRMLVVLHDANLKRTTGIDKNIKDVKYSELKKYDAGSYFDAKFKGERIPLLESVIKFAKEHGIKLNIEIKKSAYDDYKYVNNILNLINKYDFKDECIVSSWRYNLLEMIEEIDSSVITYLVLRNVDEDFLEYNLVDGYNIETNAISGDVVDKIHDDNKMVGVWTVDTIEEVEHMIDLKVDNILTNDVSLVRNIIK